MSEENVEVLRRGYAALAKGGVDQMLELTDPEFELITPASLASEPGTFRGHDGVRAWFASFDGVMEGVQLEGRTFTAFGDRVLVETVLRARGRATGIDTEQRAFLVWTVRDGLVVRGEAFAEREDALEAAQSGR
jgi:ketosteroid isomerase-like protein